MVFDCFIAALFLLCLKQASLCLLDIDKRELIVPDELPDLPYAEELHQELSEVVNRLKNMNAALQQGKKTTPKLDKKFLSKSDARLTARNKPVKKIDALKVGLGHLKSSISSPQLPAGDTRNPRLLDKIAQKTGIQTKLPADKDSARKSWEGDMDDCVIARDESAKDMERKEPKQSEFKRQSEFNVEIREILVNWFTQVFLDYQTFVIHPLDNQDMEQWIENREQMENFDKAAFLSDQPVQFLPFLAPFIESQMFASFVDAKLISWWSEPDPSLAIFDQRISQIKNKLGIDRTHSYERCQSVTIARKLNREFKAPVTSVEMFFYIFVIFEFSLEKL